MGIWKMFGWFATSDKGETIHRVSDTTSLSSKGTVYNTIGPFIHGSDGSEFTQMGNFSSDGSTRFGNTTTGHGAVFIQSDQDEYSDGFTKSFHQLGDDSL
jgi:hypothetical protein